MIELAQLKTFCAVVEERSFTRAGDTVHRTQSTVSAQIALLEKAYGQLLLDRGSKGIRLTESGKVVYDYAKRILRLVRESRERVDESEHAVRGDLIIGASTIPGTYILPKILGALKKKWPEVNISVRISNSKDIIGKILEGSLEIGAVGKKTKDRRLIYNSLARDRIVLIVPAGHRLARRTNVTLDEIRKEPFVFREGGSGTRTAVERALKNKGIRRLNVSIELGSTEAVKEGVRAGLGVSFVSGWAVGRNSLHQVNVKGLDIVRDFYTVFARGGVKRRAARAFMDFSRKLVLRPVDHNNGHS